MSSTEREAYLKQKHESFQTPAEKHEELIKAATGSPIKEKKRLLVGEANEVYEVLLETGESVILRVSHGRHYSFKAERWVLDQCAQIGVPTPKVFYVEDFELGEHAYSACVLEKLRGKPLAQMIKEGELTEAEAAPFLIETGKLLAKMHSIQPLKFGHLRGEGTAECGSWYEFINRHRGKIEYFQEVLRSRGLNPDSILKIYEIFDQYENQLTNVTPHLLHGDIGYDHIFVEGNTITGIIDFGIAKSGEPSHDLAWWDFFHENKDTLHWLEEGYASVTPLDADYEVRRHIEKLFLSLQLLNYYVGEKNEHGISIALRNMEEGLRFFSS